MAFLLAVEGTRPVIASKTTSRVARRTLVLFCLLASAKLDVEVLPFPGKVFEHLCGVEMDAAFCTSSGGAYCGVWGHVSV